MKSLNYVLISIIVLTSCSKKEQEKFNINLPHYSSKIEINRLYDFDTLLSWDRLNDNVMSHRKYYRIQNSRLGIMMEKGMASKIKEPEYYDQMTIKTPRTQTNRFPNRNIKEWLIETKEVFISENPGDKIFKFDSLTIDNKKFGVLGVKTMWFGTKVIYMTNINDESIEFEFFSNIHAPNNYYSMSLEMMKTIKIIPAANSGFAKFGRK